MNLSWQAFPRTSRLHVQRPGPQFHQLLTQSIHQELPAVVGASVRQDPRLQHHVRPHTGIEISMSLTVDQLKFDWEQFRMLLLPTRRRASQDSDIRFGPESRRGWKQTSGGISAQLPKSERRVRTGAR